MITVKELVDFLEENDAGYDVGIEQFQEHLAIVVMDGTEGAPSVCITHGLDCPVYNEDGITDEGRANIITSMLQDGGLIHKNSFKEIEAKILEGLTIV